MIGETRHGLYVNSNTQRGGFTRNVNVDRLTGTVTASFAYVFMTFLGQTGTYPPEYRALTITNSSCTGAPRVFDVRGLAESHVHGFVVRDCDFRGVTDATNVFSLVDGRRFTNVRINGTVVAR